MKETTEITNPQNPNCAHTGKIETSDSMTSGNLVISSQSVACARFAAIGADSVILRLYPGGSDKKQKQVQHHGNQDKPVNQGVLASQLP